MENFAVAERTPRDEAAQGAPGRPDIRGVLGGLFPAGAVPAPRAPGRRVLIAAAQIAAVVAGVVLLLERVPGRPSWDGIYGEDFWMFLPQALQRPWQLFSTYAGYEQLLPRVIAQFATYFPLPRAALVFAVSGALVGAGCGLFVFHASAGHVRSTPLRAVLGAALVLMPVALMEVVDSGVGTPWYLLSATFWALLWRPRTRSGMVIAALVAFTSATSMVLAILFLPLAAARLIALRQLREHAVTAGWLAGCLAQVPMVVSGYLSGQSRLNQQPGSLGHSLAFYAHDILLPSFGWHLALRLQSATGRTLATVLVAIALAVMVGAILRTQPANRPFVVTAVLAGFVLSVASTTLTPNVAAHPVVVALPGLESGSRYSVAPIFLLEAVAVVGADHLLRRRADGNRRRVARLRPAMAVSALVIVLASSWIADFRYAGFRSERNWNWAVIATRWRLECERPHTKVIVVHTAVIAQSLHCDRLR
jgi:hypothetical protein